MNPAAIAPLIVSILSFATAVFSLLLYLRMPSHRYYLAAFSLGLFAALYSFSSAMLYNSSSLMQGNAWQRGQFLTMLPTITLFMVFINEFAGCRYTHFQKVIIWIASLLFITGFTNLTPLRILSDESAFRGVEDYFGNHVLYYEMKPGVMGYLYLIVSGFGFFSAFPGLNSFRKNNPPSRWIPILSAYALIFAGAINDMSNTFEVQSRAYVLEYTFGAFIVFIGFVFSNEIIRSSKLEKALELSEQDRRIALEAGRVATWQWNVLANKIIWSENIDDVLGTVPGTIAPRPDWYLDLLTPKDRSVVEEHLAAITRPFGKDEMQFQHRLTMPFGLRWIEVRGRITERRDEKVIRIRGTVSDITAAKKADSEARIKESAIMSAINGIALADLEGRLTYANRTFLSMWGFQYPEEVINRSLDFFWKSEDDVQKVIETLHQGHGWFGELTARRKEGELFDVQVSASPVNDEDGIPILFLVSFIDISEQKKIREALQQSERDYRGLFGAAHDAIIVFKPENEIILDVNPQACHLYGFSKEEFIGLSLETLTKDVARGKKHLDIIMTDGRLHNYESVHYRKDGSEMLLDINGSLIDYKGQPAVLIINRDITERKRTEELLLQSQKRESIGMLASGVAHDFNNLLQAIVGNADLAAERLSETDPLRKYLNKITASAERGSLLTQQLLAYSGRGHFETRPVNLTSLIEENSMLFQVTLPKLIEYHAILSPALPMISADPGQIQQAIINLISNSAESLNNKKGTVTLITRTLQLGNEDFSWWKHTGEPLQSGRYVVLEVTDDGAGIDPNHLSKIFEPFFSTKFAGRGLGLAAVVGIMRSHRGGVRVDSEIGKGTSVHLAFPVTADESIRGEKDRLPVHQSKKTGVILVIDDEEFVLDFVVETLHAHGYRTIIATDGTTGLSAYEEKQKEVDLVVLDLSMPEMNGEEVLHKMKAINHDVKIILSSGYAEEHIQKKFPEGSYHTFLQKPYRPERLIKVIESILQ